MKREMYDASIHIWQFSLDEDIRIRCKNAQVRISDKTSVSQHLSDAIIGVCTFGENTESDNIIRETLWRKEQDVFYPWMDVYHTVKQVHKIRDSHPDLIWLIPTLVQQLWCSNAGATILAGAIHTKCDIIYTLYEDLLTDKVLLYMSDHHQIQVYKPPLWQELAYEWWQTQEEDGKEFRLEDIYRDAIKLYQSRNIDLLHNLLHLQKKEWRN